jgi:hypothetical protein
MIVQSQQAEHQVLKKLASYFKTPYKMLQKRYLKHPDTEENLPLFRIPALADLFSYDYVYYCLEQQGKINILDLLNPDKVENTEVFTSYVKMWEYVEPNHVNSGKYLCCVYIKGYCWVFTHTNSVYRGFGGLHLYTGHILEPFKNFFSFHCPD